MSSNGVQQDVLVQPASRRHLAVHLFQKDT